MKRWKLNGKYTWIDKQGDFPMTVTATSRCKTRDGWQVHILVPGDKVGWNVPADDLEDI